MFRAEAKGRKLHFDTEESLVGANEVFKDRETGSRWQQALAMATDGPLKGAHLEIYPFLLANWGEWEKQHPDTLVLKPLPGYAERMPGMSKFIRRGMSGEGAAPKGAFPVDSRLRPKEIILGLEIGDQMKAFPLPALRKTTVVNDHVAGVPVLIVHQPQADTTTAFDARVKGKALSFSATNTEASRLTDAETHSTWNAYGRCVDGKLKGTQLKQFILIPEFWFAWSEFHPKTEVYSAQ